MTLWRGALAALALFLLAQPSLAQQRGKPGEFDFYLLALSWTPSYCEAEGDKRGRDEQCSRARPYAFVVHGFWPQYERGYPRSCVDRAPYVQNHTLQSVSDLMPTRGLILHQWRTHGTCAGLQPEAYFQKLREARERVQIPARFHRLNDYAMVSPAEVERAFIEANPQLPAAAISVTCDDRRLREVRICMSKDLAFRDCTENERRACRASRVVMPPVRGG
jgi:ribonuclease T2